MGERLRIVLNWAAFVFLAYWVAVFILTITSAVFDLGSARSSSFLFFGMRPKNFFLIALLTYPVWQILQYIVWGGFKFIPWKK